MSGGAWEYVMSVMVDQSGNPLSGLNDSNNSGFKGGYVEGGSLLSGYAWPDSKYYETYGYSTNLLDYTKRRLGDATSEMGPFRSIIYANNNFRYFSSWYVDYARFVYTEASWFFRGGAYDGGSESGIFAFGRYHGHGHTINTFRLILTPTI